MTTPDPAPQTDQPPAQGAPPEPPAQGAPADPPADTTDWVKEARKWEERAKENKKTADANAAAAKKLAELEEAQKTELEKAQTRAEAAERRAQDLEEAQKQREADAELKKQIEDWKEAVSKETGVPAAVLRGATEEEIKAHAETLKEVFPVPDERRGAYVPSEGRHTGSSTTESPRDAFARIIKAT